MAPRLDRSSSILIVGGGTFGTSAAFHLANRGYKNVTVLDRFPPPSEIAAGNDINKVIRADYPEPLYANLATESVERWSDPNGLYAGLYHRTGWLLAAPENGSSLSFIQGSIETARDRRHPAAKFITPDEVRQTWPAYCGPMEGWEVFHNSSGGWADARTALKRMADAAIAKGVKYLCGDTGYVKQLLFDYAGNCIGAKSADGSANLADHVILAAGAAAGHILDMEGQLVAKGHTVGHIQLSPEEVEKYRNVPIIDHFEGGIMFPPQADGIIKIGAVQFVTNRDPNHRGSPSLPRYRCDHPLDTVPKPVEDRIRAWVRQLTPELAQRLWFETRICWDADMPDLNFLIDNHPAHEGLSLAVGGSAHGFKFLPVIGKYIVDMLEGKLDAQTQQKWRWRPGLRVDHIPDPHILPLIDLNGVPGWGTETAKL
ncbi:hypothetical protein KC331_g489 [Hortaea werneckii]|uniref:FAD dependent oxidoreductase domain-containing protein n=1 Tax=Hortaea werneckii TaxID=91943 RepID=A0A3M7CWQ8_HORWE|nr:hypothetical protein KC331_g489 [Hortaea werneckii]KAI7721821.1 hypothetical protein KC353_g1069 [Hortaea werneckii]RMY56106.1 hypothetical protein D0865_03820 [Hortaea werneckii]